LKGKNTGTPGWRGLLGVLTVGFAVLAGPFVGAQAASAATSDHRITGHIEVASVNQAPSFDGVVSRFGPTGLDGVPQCAATNCAKVDMGVNLPRHVPDNGPGGVQPTIEWHQQFNDILGLYVYREDGKGGKQLVAVSENGKRHKKQGGMLVGSSDAGVATFQSVRLNDNNTLTFTPNGRYTLYIAYEGYVDDNGVAPSDTIAFGGWAQVEFAPPKFPVRDLLPDIIPLPTTSITFKPIAIFGDTPDANVPSCFKSEVNEHPGLKLCLRVEQRMYDDNTANTGPVEINFSLPTGQRPPSAPVVQRIYRSDGTSWTRPAGNVDLHKVHDHYHYQKYSKSDAYAIDANGNPVGAPVAEGEKEGFCLADTDVVKRQHQRFVAPMINTAPGCLEPRSFSPDGTISEYVEGEGPGNGDTYGPDLPDQFENGNSLYNGVFIVRTVVDPDHKLLESNPHNNCIQSYARVAGIGTANPQATILNTFNGHTAPVCFS
jgi:hypothetical protein